jgi:hypothetical protein
LPPQVAQSMTAVPSVGFPWSERSTQNRVPGTAMLCRSVSAIATGPGAGRGSALERVAVVCIALDFEAEGLVDADDLRAVARRALEAKVLAGAHALEPPFAAVALLQLPLRTRQRGSSAQTERGGHTRWFSPPLEAQPVTVRPSVPDRSSAVPDFAFVIANVAPA